MFTNKIVLVTGAASGIGRDAAIAFAEKGATVVVSDLDKEGLHETARMIKEKQKAAMVSAQKEPALAGSGPGKGESFEIDETSGNRDVDVMAVVTDVSDPGEVQNLVNRVVEKYGRLDVACNNAGVGGEMKATADYTIEEWDWVMDINLRGQWLCMKHQIPAMLANGGGSIINISSILGVVGFANAPAYVAAKHGLIGLSKAAALEYSARGLRVNVIAPAFIETPMLEKAGITTDEQLKQSIVDLHPIGRLGKPREVADAIVWLASEEASFVTGHTLLVDGGYTIR